MSEARLRAKSIELGGGLTEPGYEYVLLEDALEEIREMQATFDLRWNADQRAIKRWQAAHPGNELVWPDHADLVIWLLEERERVAHKAAEIGFTYGSLGRDFTYAFKNVNDMLAEGAGE